MRAKESAEPLANFADDDSDIEEEEDNLQRRLARSRWAALIKKVYEIDPLLCPNCGEQMRIVALIDKRDQADVIEKILKHCKLWVEPAERAPPKFSLEPACGELAESKYIPIDEFLADF